MIPFPASTAATLPFGHVSLCAPSTFSGQSRRTGMVMGRDIARAVWDARYC